MEEIYIAAAGFSNCPLAGIRQPHSLMRDASTNMTLCEFHPEVKLPTFLACLLPNEGNSAHKALDSK